MFVTVLPRQKPRQKPQQKPQQKATSIHVQRRSGIWLIDYQEIDLLLTNQA